MAAPRRLLWWMHRREGEKTGGIGRLCAITLVYMRGTGAFILNQAMH